MPIRLRWFVAALGVLSLWWEIHRRAPGDVMFGSLVLFGAVYAMCFVLGDVWPTPWRYERTGEHLVRIRRATGAAELLTPQGWRPLNDVRQPE